MTGKLLVALLLVLAGVGGWWLYRHSQSTVSVPRAVPAVTLTKKEVGTSDFLNLLKTHAQGMASVTPDQVYLVTLPGSQGAEYTASYAYLDDKTTQSWYAYLTSPGNGWTSQQDSFSGGGGRILVGREEFPAPGQGAVLTFSRDKKSGVSQIVLNLFTYAP